MDNQRIQEIALANGFKLKPQPDGTMALNPYVFEFARALLDEGQLEMTVMEDRCLDYCAENIKLQEENIALKAEVEQWKRQEAAVRLIGEVKRDELEHENETLKQKVLELEGSYDGCEKANEYNKAVIRKDSEYYDALKVENERLRNAAKPVIDYWFEENESKTHADDNRAFLELSNAYYRRPATKWTKS